jgi:hypothetical protein
MGLRWTGWAVQTTGTVVLRQRKACRVLRDAGFARGGRRGSGRRGNASEGLTGHERWW